MNFKKWVKSIQTAAYNSARTVYQIWCFGPYFYLMCRRQHQRIPAEFSDPLYGKEFHGVIDHFIDKKRDNMTIPNLIQT
jgi:hypothetical protein